MSNLEERVGHYPQAIEFAKSAEHWARAALPLYQQAPNATMQTLILGEVATALNQEVRAYIAADRLQDAETALRAYLQFSNEYQLDTRFQAVLNMTGSKLRYAQREFSKAEQFAKKSDELFASMGLDTASAQRTGATANLLSALVGQKRWSEGMALLDTADSLNSGGNAPAATMRYAQDRGLVYLHRQLYKEAAKVFEFDAARNKKLYGDTHFLTAQSTGLQGAALWRSGLPENKTRGFALLKSAVRDFMAPTNSDFGEAIGIRKEIRTIVFDAYLGAASSGSIEEAVAALGPADWARGGVVNDALNDAAVRSAANTPVMADIVRREQDAKNEITGLRRYLAGEIGGATPALPQVAAQMRERIAALEVERAKLQSEVKAKFPDYDRLIHPGATDAKDIGRQLSADQALVLLLPGADAVYVWGIANDRPPLFVRAAMDEAAVTAIVKKLRVQLDFGSSALAGKKFDSVSAFTLYDKLLAPLEPVIQGKSQLVVAAGGALSQLPFSLLQTAAGAGFDTGAPWLIKRQSVTQVPSLSGWLSIKAMASAKPAAQAFAGWGDPVFNAQAPVTDALNPPDGSVAGSSSISSISSRRIVLTRSNVTPDSAASAAPVSVLRYAQIPTLPDTRDELLSIARTLQSDTDKDLMLGARATRDSVLKANQDGVLIQKRVIAFATHGLMAGDLPNLTQPALALAANGTEEQNPLSPLLTLQDVLTLKLNADWVVLSACNSAAEDGRGDEAMSGLARGFFYAGSRSLLVTHWAVESESAKLLTTATFAHYAANPKAPKAESLRQAMLQVMAMPQFNHPAFWAPYALVGDGGR
jgi:CHAT domain-containing protein/tetratricopeptide (TPR) repeat protein